MLRLFVDSLYTSPYAMSVFVALQEKELPFAIEKVDLHSNQNQLPEFVGTSVTRRVPTLVMEGFTLSESSAITEYLDEVYPGTSLYPRDRKGMARARQIQAWLRSDLIAIRNERPTDVIFYGPTSRPLSQEGQLAAEKLLFAANTWLAHGSINLFDEWSLADLDLSLMLNRLILNNDAVPDRLVSYARRQWDRLSVQQWISQPRPCRDHLSE